MIRSSWAPSVSRLQEGTEQQAYKFAMFGGWSVAASLSAIAGFRTALTFSRRN
jgi:hypothetical protein